MLRASTSSAWGDLGVPIPLGVPQLPHAELVEARRQIGQVPSTCLLRQAHCIAWTTMLRPSTGSAWGGLGVPVPLGVPNSPMLSWSKHAGRSAKLPQHARCGRRIVSPGPPCCVLRQAQDGGEGEFQQHPTQLLGMGLNSASSFISSLQKNPMLSLSKHAEFFLRAAEKLRLSVIN
jgi:hypothetical protein